MVGQALKFLPSRLSRSHVDDGEDDDDEAEELLVPWHRVLSSSGKISLRGSSAATERQAARLRAEGIEVRGGEPGSGDGGRVSLTTYGWFPAVEQASEGSSEGERRVRTRRA
jgi:methylated-DNA-protein-cysteine methyltransferase-like protein